jgi:hypothetical protein
MRHLFSLLALVFLACVRVDAQTGRVTLTATVSPTVALSVPRDFTQPNLQVVSSLGNTVRITLAGDDDQPAVVRVPLLVRSNSSFKVLAEFESKTALLAELSTTDARATGALVAPQLVNDVNVRPQLDVDVSRPLLVLSGPRVSLGGTLASPNNALQVTLLIRLQPHQTHDWLVHLTLVARAESPTQ